jgi:type I restriction enzyme S subunit
MQLKRQSIQAETGFIPADWKLRRLGEEISFEGGSQPPLTTFISTYKNDYIRLLQIRDYKTDKYQTYVPLKLAKRFCDKDDIMIGRYGPPIFQILRGLEGAYNVALVKAIPSQNILKEYAYFFLKQSTLFEFVEKLSQRSSGQTGIDLKELRAYPLPLPKLAEQTAIATALSDADALISNLEKLIAKKRNIKQAVMQQLLQPKEDWEVKKFGEVIKSCQLGGNYPNIAQSSNYPLMKMGNIQQGNISLSKVEYIPNEFKPAEKDRLRNGDVLFNTRNTLDLVGKVAIWRSELTEAYFNSNLMRIEFNNNYISSNHFMNYILNTKRMTGRLRDIATGTTSVAAIYTRDLINTIIEIPSLSEQIYIATILSHMDEEISGIETTLGKYKQIKKGMMQQLLTGKIRLV